MLAPPRFYTDLFKLIWTADAVPTAKQVADWMEARGDRPADWETLVKRLRAWPEGRKYPPIPDDEALRYGTDEAKWWEPGAKIGTVGAFVRENAPPPEEEEWNS